MRTHWNFIKWREKNFIALRRDDDIGSLLTAAATISLKSRNKFVTRKKEKDDDVGDIILRLVEQQTRERDENSS